MEENQDRDPLNRTTAMLDSRPEYFRYLLEFMSFKDGFHYQPDAVFTNRELLRITPIDIERWFKLKVFGTPDPANNAQPTFGRSSSLEHYKKSISYYMPDRLHGWCISTGTGNPTRSAQVNSLINKVKKLEVRKLGKASAARRALVDDEFLQTLRLLHLREGDVMKILLISAVMNFQYSLIARIDDACHMEKEELKPHSRFDFALTVRLNWSKNVMEERDAPEQIILGSMDWRTCLFLSLAVYLEVAFGHGEALHHRYLFGYNDNPVINNSYVSSTLVDCWKDPRFIPKADGLIGTHSLRKFGATKARESGASKDDIDARGRWRKRRVSDRYVELALPYPDAKVCGMLCMKGPIMYSLRENSGISTTWLKENVVPNILLCAGIRQEVAVRLALPLLWAALEEEVNILPDFLRERIADSYATLRNNQLPHNVNPVRRIPLAITGFEGELFITEIYHENDEIGIAALEAARVVQPGQALAMANLGASYDQFRALYSKLDSIIQRVAESQEQQLYHSRLLQDLLTKVSRNVIRLAAQPTIVRRRQATVENHREEPPQQEIQGEPPQQEVPQYATLTRAPRTLQALWAEWEVGIGGRKAAKDFTPRERGAVKREYSRRMIVWQMISRLVRANHTADRAIDLIYSTYGGNKTVSEIIALMRRDRMNRVVHPNLRV